MVQGTETSADGTFRVRVPPGEQYVYPMSQPPMGITAQEQRGMRTVHVANGQTVTVDFAFNRVAGRTVRGQVVDEQNRPVPGANVSVEPPRWTMSGASAKTDAEGRFAFADVPEGFGVTARRGGLVTEQAIVVGRQAGELTLVVKPQQLTSGRVVVRGDDGRPAVGVRVRLQISQGGIGRGFDEQTADQQGQVVFEKLRAAQPYTVSVASSKGFGVGMASMLPKAGEEVTVQVTLPRAESFVAGEVVDDDLKPVAGIEVELNSAASGHHRVKTDENGRFRFEDVVAGDRVSVFVRQGQVLHSAEDVNVTAGKDDVVIMLPTAQR